MSAPISSSIGIPQTWTYTGDDGESFEIASGNGIAQAWCGELPAGDESNPPFPFHWQPRQVILRGLVDGVAVYVHVACSASAAIFLNGPGKSITIAGVDFDVISCNGEQRNT